MNRDGYKFLSGSATALAYAHAAYALAEHAAYGCPRTRWISSPLT